MNDRMLKTADVAVYLNVSGKTVHRLVKNHGLPAILIGGQYRFLERQFQRWLVRRQSRTSCNLQVTSTNAPRASSFGSKSLAQMGDRYADLLKPQTRSKQKNV